MPPRSRSDVSYAKTTLRYPVFAADFDPYNRGYLVVGGGGGESNSGVPNRISVLDVSNRAEITTAADIDLARDEDSVQSLGTLATKEGLILLAGINSSEKEQNAGRNEHLRSFEIRYPPRKKQKTEDAGPEEKGVSGMLAKRSLFKPSTGTKKETYQRLLRLSPSQKSEQGSRRIGAIATGLAKESEIIVFDATTATTGSNDILTHLELPEGSEATDLDIVTPDQGQFSLTYCTDYDIYEQTYKYDFASKKTEKTPKGPRRVHQMPFPDAFANPATRPKFRCIRFLKSQNVLAACNKPNKSGAELRIFHLYPTGPSIQILTKALPSHMKVAASMDVCALGADKDGNEQFVVAVAGQDISIEVFTTNYQRSTDTFTPFRPYLNMRQVHPQQMTKICFSPFHRPVSPAGEKYIRLASVSYGNTVIVDTFPLQAFHPKDKHTRYVLSHPSDETFAKWMYTYLAVASLVVLVAAFVIQSFRGGFSDNTSGPFSLLPKKVRTFLDQPAMAAYGNVKMVHQEAPNVLSSASSMIPSSPAQKVEGRLRSLLRSHHQASSSPNPPPGSKESSTPALVLRPASADSTGLAIEQHSDKDAFLEQDADAKHWEDLDEHSQARWKEKLKDAGEWVESEGESVLKGILFSEWAGLVGEGVGAVLREL